MKVTKKGRLSDFAGILSDKEAESLEKNIKESRRYSRERMDKIRKK